ncbi:MAG: SH3 domain-containing protein [Anaerolineales bacterium]|nr:SH3 domain-containing protein [Anaerolineales bacterium]
MRKQILFTFLVLIALGMACGVSTPIPKENQLATVVAKTLTARPVFTPIPTLTATNVPTDVVKSVITASGPYYIYTRAQNVNLRTQPGTLFPVSRVMAQGTRLQVLGLSHGGEWVSVLNDEGISGWVGILNVDEFPVSQFPFVEPKDSQLLIGRVLDANGLPVNGIKFAIEQKTASKSLRTDAATDADGCFYAYLPRHLSGVWTVSYLSTVCTSNTMDANCQCIGGVCGQSQPASANVTLPATGQLNFVWK